MTPRVEAGDLWALGDHRLLCGDSTDAADVAALMDGEQAKLCVTSPPYWVGKEYERERTWVDVQRFIASVSAAMAGACSHRIVINTGAPPAGQLRGKPAHRRLLLDDWQAALEKGGFLLRYCRIWAKEARTHSDPRRDCISQGWEFIGVFYRPETFEGSRRIGEPWAMKGIWSDISPVCRERNHPAPFPVELPARNIRLYTDPGDLVLEPFLGSGSTMLAAERLGRRCFGMEIAESYCDIALARWEKETGRTAELLHRAPTALAA